MVSVVRTKSGGGRLGAAVRAVAVRVRMIARRATETRARPRERSVRAVRRVTAGRATAERPRSTEVRFGEWIREGECNRCGSCCKGNPFAGGDAAYPPVVAGYCPLFRLHDGVATCSDRRHPYYMSGCNVFPTHPGQIVDHPDCSYTFRAAD